MEFWIRFWFFPRLNTKYMMILGIAVTAVGQFIRSLAMVTCGESFNHLIQQSKKENHVLITHGMWVCRVNWVLWETMHLNYRVFVDTSFWDTRHTLVFTIGQLGRNCCWAIHCTQFCLPLRHGCFFIVEFPTKKNRWCASFPTNIPVMWLPRILAFPFYLQE